MQHLVTRREMEESANTSISPKEEAPKEQRSNEPAKECGACEPYSIPEDSVEAKDFDTLRARFTQIMTAELAKEKPNLEHLNKLMETMDNARRVYVGFALFSQVKFNLFR